MDNVNGINIGGFQNTSNNVYTNNQKNDSNLSKINHTNISNQSPTLNQSQTEIETIDFDDVSNIEEKKQNNEFLEGLKTTGATITVGSTSLISGILKLGENIQDGGTWVKGTVASGILDLFGADELADDIRKKTQEEIARDQVGEINEFFYEQTGIGQAINEASILKYDSKTAQAIQKISTEATKFVAATALTVGTAGLAAPVSAMLVFGTGAVQGIGDSAEKRYQDPNNNDYATGAILLDGVGSGFSWYASGKLGQGAVGLTKAIGQSISQTGVKGTTTFFKTMLKEKAKEFNLKNLRTWDFWKKTVKNGVFEFDQLLDSASMGVDNITSAINNGTEVDWEQLTKEVLGSYALNCAFSGFTNLFSKIPTNNIIEFDIDEQKNKLQDLIKRKEELLNIKKSEEFLKHESWKQAYGNNLYMGAKGKWVEDIKYEYKDIDNRINDLKNKIDNYKLNNNNFETTKLAIDDLKYKKTNPVTNAIARLESNLKRYVYNNTNNFMGLNEKIMNKGLYHFTDAADKILESGYIRASGENIFDRIMGVSYGKPKTFFFADIPEVGAFATNLDSIPLKTIAVKVDASVDVILDSKLKVRNLDDGAITWDGRFDLTGNSTSKEYFCLVKENDELIYKSVTKEFYDNYENTIEGNILNEFVKNKTNVQTIKNDYLVGLSQKHTNTKTEKCKSLIKNIFPNTEIMTKNANLIDITPQQNNLYTREKIFDTNTTAEIVPEFKEKLDKISNVKIDFEAELRKANYYTSKGDFYTIKVNSLEDITMEDLSKLSKHNSIIFETTDGTTYSIQELKNRLNKSLSIKNEIIYSAKDIENPELKARKIYMELNKKIHYDISYLKGDSANKEKLLNQITNFENLNKNNTVICKGWSELYTELLIEAGFDANDIKIIKPEGANHWWVEIDLKNGTILSADATDAMDGTIDLATCKGGIQTKGFMLINKSDSGLRAKAVYANKENNQNFLEFQKDYIKKLDKELGYVGEGGYLLEEMEKSSKMFTNNKLYEKLFGTKNMEKNIQRIFDMDIPENMDGYELYAYYDYYRKKLLPGNEGYNLQINTLYNKLEDGIEPINLITYIGKDNQNMIQLYSPNLGKIRFNSLTERHNYINQLNIIR